MTTYAKPTIDWSTFPDSDGEPMAENTENMVQMIDLIFALQDLLRAQGRVAAVGGNQILYYNERNGRDHVSPDVYVALDVAPPPPPKWQTWVQGKVPDLVWEITSRSTQQEDIGSKRDLYTRLGVREYYVYDPNGEVQPSFRGYARRAGRLESLPVLESGGIMSPLLRAELRPTFMTEGELRPAGTYLRVIDPATGEPIQVSDEVRRDYEHLRREYRVAEESRLAAEERAARAEAALREALAALARPGGNHGDGSE